jgi:hypothetical protein
MSLFIYRQEGAMVYIFLAFDEDERQLLGFTELNVPELFRGVGREHGMRVIYT